RLRYKRFPLSIPQKYRSHQPSPSTSPAATPDPARRSWVLTPLSIERTLVKRIPEVVPGWRVNPSRPCFGTGSTAQRYPDACSQLSSAALLRSTQKATPANKSRLEQVRPVQRFAGDNLVIQQPFHLASMVH